MSDIPEESMYKYGRTDDDLDSFADMLDGGNRAARARADHLDVGSSDESVDFDVLREAVNNSAKYGR